MPQPADERRPQAEPEVVMPRRPREERVELSADERRHLELIELSLERETREQCGAPSIPPSPLRLALLVLSCGALLVGLATGSVFLVLLTVAAVVMFGLDMPELNDNTCELLRRRLALLAGWCGIVLFGLATGSVLVVLLALATTLIFGNRLRRRRHLPHVEQSATTS